MSRIDKSKETEAEQWLPGVGVGMGSESWISLQGDEKGLEQHSGDGCTTVNVLNAALRCPQGKSSPLRRCSSFLKGSDS